MSIAGKHVLITQAKDQATEQIKILKKRDADIIHKPTIAIKPLKDYSEFDEHLRNGHEFSWIIFTSANGVAAFSNRIKKLSIDVNIFQSVRFAVIGSATAAAVASLGLTVDFKPEYTTAAGFLHEFTRQFQSLTGVKVLFPAGNIARNTIPDGLRDAGADVVRVTAYDTVPVHYPSQEIIDLFVMEPVDITTFTSSSSVENLIALIPENVRQTVLPKIRAASIGPMTSKTLRTYGIDPVVEASGQTIAGLVDAVGGYFN